MAEGERRDAAEKQYGTDDLRRGRTLELREPIHDATSRRCDQHGNAAGSRIGNGFAGLSESWRHSEAGNRMPRRVAARGCSIHGMNTASHYFYSSGNFLPLQGLLRSVEKSDSSFEKFA